MIPAVRDIAVESTIQAEETIKYRVSAEATQHFMSILAGIYKDEARAVIREYTTNALDSHIESGQTRPVELTLPTRFDKRFAVQDYGVGLSLADLREVFTAFGESTKRTAATDNQAGSLGIGSKVALAYSGNFQVVTVKNGERISALISLDENASGQLEVLSREQTDEPNGVRVMVPVTGNVFDFNTSVRQFAMFSPGKIIIDGEQVEPLDKQFTRLDGDIYIDMDKKLGTDYIVMGNVSYPVDFNIVHPMHESFRTVIYVPMRAVAFTPSREDLNYTRHTRATLDQYRDRISNKFRHFTEKVVEDADSRREAYNLSVKFNTMVSPQARKPYTYKGVDLPMRSDVVARRMSWGHPHYGYARISDEDYVQKISEGLTFLTNWTNTRFTKTQAEKLELAGVVRDPHDTASVVSVKDDFDMSLLDGCTVLDWEVVRKIKRPGASATNRPKSNGGKPVKHYESPRNGQMEFHVPDTTKNIWYGTKTDMRQGRYNNWYSKSVDYSGPNDEFYYVTMTDRPAFLKKYPSAQPYRNFHVPAAEAAVASFTPADFALSEQSDTFPQLHFITHVKHMLDDPDLVRIANGLSRDEVRERDALNKRIGDARAIIQKTPGSVQQRLNQKIPSPYNPYNTKSNPTLLDRYPLFTAIEVKMHAMKPEARQALVDYLNSCYAESINKESE